MVEVFESMDSTNVHFFDVFELTSQWQSELPTGHWTPKLAIVVIQMLISNIVEGSSDYDSRSCPTGIHYRGFNEDSDCRGNKTFHY